MARDIECPADGIHLGLSMERYLRLDAWHKGDVETILTESPAHVNERRAEGFDGQKESTRYGTAVHAAILEPELYRTKYALLPEGDGRTAAIKDAKRALEAAGKVGIPARWCDTIAQTVEYLDRCALTRGALAVRGPGDANEVTLVATDPLTGLRLVARPDAWRPSIATVVDIKSARDYKPRAFAAAAASYGYDVGDAFYAYVAQLLGHRVEEMLFVVVPNAASEARGPFIPYVYRMTEEYRDAAAVRMHAGLGLLAECLKDGVWPAYNEDVIDLHPTHGRRLELGMVQPRR